MEQAQRIRASTSGRVCPKCGGDHWIFYKKFIEEYQGELNFASECASCGHKVYDYSGFPAEFAEADITKFNFNIYSKDMKVFEKVIRHFINNFEYWRKQGKGLYLWSNTPGSGKTFLACCLGNSAALINRVGVKFITANDYITAVGNSLKRESGAADQSEVYRTCDLLILDDVGAQKGGEWQTSTLFQLINNRGASGLITIYTANMPPVKLNLDSRTISRIVKQTIILALPEDSIRGQLAEKEQNQFLQEIVGV